MIKNYKIGALQKLQSLFNDYADRRICVVGGTCTGKSTLLKSIPSALDMDSLVFPQLTQEESDYVCQSPWTPVIGQKMVELTKKYVTIAPGHPVFGTVVLPCDLIVHLTISDDALRLRTAKRNVKFEDAKNMQRQIEQEVVMSQIPTITISMA